MDIETTDGRTVEYPFATNDFRCARCRRLVTVTTLCDDRAGQGDGQDTL